MYAFVQARQGLVWAIVALQVLGPLGGGGARVAAGRPTEEMKVETEVFSPQWVEDFSGDDPGCAMGRMSYTWRSAGFGSNINNLMSAWVHAILVEGWSDVAVLMDDKQLQEMECSAESGGLASRGWGCMFSSMPHLCMFDSVKMWKKHLDFAGVSAEDKQEGERMKRLTAIRHANISKSFEVLDIDQRGTRAVMTTYMWKYFAPWVLNDVQVVTHMKETFQSSPFVGLHIRRGDKIKTNSKKWKHSVESYLEEAVSVLEKVPDGPSVDAIKGIWVASDSTDVIDEVREKAGAYFPSVLSEDIVYVAGGVPGGVQIEKVPTRSESQGYGSFIYMVADVEQMVAADVFIGSCSSNLGRLVMVLRDGLGKDKNTAISLDTPWEPHRQRSLVLD